MTHTMTWAPVARGSRWSLWTIRAATAAGLAIDAYVHLDLAAVYREAGGAISEGVVFRAEAVAGLLAATPLIATDGGLLPGRTGGPGQRASRDGGGAERGTSGRSAARSLYDPAWFPEKLPGGRRGRRARKDVFTDRGPDLHLARRYRQRSRADARPAGQLLRLQPLPGRLCRLLTGATWDRGGPRPQKERETDEPGLRHMAR